MRQLLLVALLALAGTPCSVAASRQCSCAVQQSRDKQLRAAREIFVGEVVAVEPFLQPFVPGARDSLPAQHIRFAVRERWKGAAVDTASAWAFVAESMCGGRVRPGERWLVVLADSVRELNVNGTACSNAIRVEHAEAWLRLLGPTVPGA